MERLNAYIVILIFIYIKIRQEYYIMNIELKVKEKCFEFKSCDTIDTVKSLTFENNILTVQNDYGVFDFYIDKIESIDIKIK
jgi:hypothetical protein